MKMMYRFMTLNNNTEITHSEMRLDGSVRVCIETPVLLGFKSAECLLPQYEWKNISGMSENEIEYYDAYLHSLAHVILELAQSGGFDHAADF